MFKNTDELIFSSNFMMNLLSTVIFVMFYVKISSHQWSYTIPLNDKFSSLRHCTELITKSMFQIQRDRPVSRHEKSDFPCGWLVPDQVFSPLQTELLVVSSDLEIFAVYTASSCKLLILTFTGSTSFYWPFGFSEESFISVLMVYKHI